jgi:hypothetical protein
LLDQYFQKSDGLQDFTSPLDTFGEEKAEDMFQAMGPDWML